MPATLFHKIAESFAGTLFVGHSEGDLLYLEQVALRSTTATPIVDSMVQALADMKQLSGNTVAAPSHVVRFMGQIGIVTPYFEAVPLRMLQIAARESQTAFPARVATKVVLDICDGLCQYHALDAKLCGGVCPDHLLVGTDGDTRIGNVAVAAIATRESPWRAKAERLAYLAPEQVSTSRVSDARTDVYAVGVVLWELLANQPRLGGAPAQMIESLRKSKGPPSLSPLDQTRVSKGFLSALSRALHPDPAERHPSVGAFARALLEAGEEPASSADVATCVEKLAQQPLQALRTAIALQEIETLTQNRKPRSSPLPRLEAMTKVSARKASLSPPASEAQVAAHHSDHTAVFKVTAELLQRARRGPHGSEPPPRAAALTEPEASAADERTVTFEVPEDLLEEARRLYEATERAAPESVTGGATSSENQLSDSETPSITDAPDSERTSDRIRSEALLRKLSSDAPARAFLEKSVVPRYEEDVTTIWRPQNATELPEIVPVQSLNIPPRPLSAARGAPKRTMQWLLGLVIFVVVSALALIVKRVTGR